MTISSIATCAETDCATQNGAVPDGRVSAIATFVTGNGFMTVTLSDSLANPTSIGQLVSGLAFAVSEGQTIGTLGSTSANNRKVKADGTFVDLGPSPTGWALATDFNGGFELCALCTDLGASGPSRLLIGQPSGAGSYQSANASIAGNKPHNPFTTGTSTFLITIPTVTTQSTIASATFFFGTTEGVSVAGSCSAGGGIIISTGD